MTQQSGSEVSQSQSVAILIAEDDDHVRLVASDMLADAGFSVVEAQDGRGALALLLARDDVRLLFTDCDMPGSMGGLALARFVHERWPEIRILVTSGKTHPAPADLPPGAHFLRKPYGVSALVGAVETLLGVRDDADGAPLLPQSVTGQPTLVEGGQIAAAPIAAPSTE
ncbi:response regulator [Methylobacterium sp. NEAU K]|uniref:response regulator n=1 Tax=Methylobacterium sp. NEAU K TaxID=3064946 RepID=UPI00351ED201